MNLSIAKEMHKRYKVSIHEKGFWHDGDTKRALFGYSIVLHGVTLISTKSYKRYLGAELAAKKLIKNIEYNI